jgi:hypothetical protein
MKNFIAIILVGMCASVALSGPKAVAPVTYIDSEKVSAMFAKGGPLIETPGYKVHAGRRQGPGFVELHTRETDVFYIVDRTTTYGAWGTVVGGEGGASGQRCGS